MPPHNTGRHRAGRVCGGWPDARRGRSSSNSSRQGRCRGRGGFGRGWGRRQRPGGGAGGGGGHGAHLHDPGGGEAGRGGAGRGGAGQGGAGRGGAGRSRTEESQAMGMDTANTGAGLWTRRIATAGAVSRRSAFKACAHLRLLAASCYSHDHVSLGILAGKIMCSLSPLVRVLLVGSLLVSGMN